MIMSRISMPMPVFYPNNNYYYHKLMWKFFTDNESGKRDFIYKVVDTNDSIDIYVISATEPIPFDMKAKVSSKHLPDDFFSHGLYEFMLKANVTKSRASDGKVVSVTSEEDIELWMNRKAANNGFRVNSMGFSKNPNRILGKPGHDVYLNPVDFTGVIEVEDIDKFRHAVLNGIGRNKGMGFGMLMVKPITE